MKSVERCSAVNKASPVSAMEMSPIVRALVMEGRAPMGLSVSNFKEVEMCALGDPTTLSLYLESSVGKMVAVMRRSFASAISCTPTAGQGRCSPIALGAVMGGARKGIDALSFRRGLMPVKKSRALAIGSSVMSVG